MVEYVKSLFSKQMTKRFLTLSIVCLLLYLMRSLMNLFLFTFLFTFLLYSAQNSIHTLMQRIFPVKIKKVVVTAVLYLAIVVLIIILIYNYVPIAIKEAAAIISLLIEMITNFSNKTYDSEILNYIVARLQEIDFASYVENKSSSLLKIAGSISGLGFNILMALILSLFFILEKDRIVRFVSGFKGSRISWFFDELKYFGSRLVSSFGKVIEAQFLIAICNTVLSVIALSILGFHQLFGLGLMIFVLSLIPVAGVIISFVPLAIIAYRMNGIVEVVYVLIIIVIIHMIESYFLNPKFMSAKTDLPIFFTFLLLLVSEHLMGIWGLIIGIPIFIFILDLLEFKNPGKPGKHEKVS